MGAVDNSKVTGWDYREMAEGPNSICNASRWRVKPGKTVTSVTVHREG